MAQKKTAKKNPAKKVPAARKAAAKKTATKKAAAKKPAAKKAATKKASAPKKPEAIAEITDLVPDAQWDKVENELNKLAVRAQEEVAKNKGKFIARLMSWLRA